MDGDLPLIDVLNGGADDFSPFGMFFDAPAAPAPSATPAGDRPSTPMSGSAICFTIKRPPARYYKLTYTWGGASIRPHPGHGERAAGAGHFPLLQWETRVFGTAPQRQRRPVITAIAQISDLSPAKRMWPTFRDATSARLPERRAPDGRRPLVLPDWVIAPTASRRDLRPDSQTQPSST